MRFAGLLAALCVLLIPSLHAQDIDGLKLGMKKDSVCQFVQVHPGYSFASGTCPNLEDFVTISVTTSAAPVGNAVNLIFLDGEVHALWTVFPEANYVKVSKDLTKRYGLPEDMWRMKAGDAKLEAGLCRRNAQGDFVFDAGSSQLVVRPGVAPAHSTNFYLYWRKHDAHVFLEQQNKEIDGQMTGWYAIIAPDAGISNSR